MAKVFFEKKVKYDGFSYNCLNILLWYSHTVIHNGSWMIITTIPQHLYNKSSPLPFLTSMYTGPPSHFQHPHYETLLRIMIYLTTYVLGIPPQVNSYSFNPYILKYEESKLSHYNIQWSAIVQWLHKVGKLLPTQLLWWITTLLMEYYTVDYHYMSCYLKMKVATIYSNIINNQPTK